MSTKRKPSAGRATTKQASADGAAEAVQATKPTISPAERWALITEHAHARAQKHRFVGGNPFEHLLAAEKEIDARYVTDFEGVFALTDANEIAKQLKSVFAGYGLGQRCLGNILAMYRDGLEKLAALNRRHLSGLSDRHDEQTTVLRDAANEAVETLQLFALGWQDREGIAQQAEQSAQAMKNALSHLRALNNKVDEVLPQSPPSAHGEAASAAHSASLQETVAMAYKGKGLEELVQAPVSALKGVSESDAAKLKEAFGIESIRDMATHRLAEWAQGIVILANTRKGAAKKDVKKAEGKAYKARRLRDIADAPIDQLQGIDKQQASLLRKGFGIKTVRDFANHRLFCAARAILILAATER